MTKLQFRNKLDGTAFSDPDAEGESELAPASSPKIKLPKGSEAKRPSLDEQWEAMLDDDDEEAYYSGEEAAEPAHEAVNSDGIYRGEGTVGEVEHSSYGSTSASREKSKPRNRFTTKRITKKDLTVLRLLGQFQYGTADQLRAAFEGEVGTSKGAKRKKSGRAVTASVMGKRLKTLEELGLVESLTFGRKLWFCTSNGIAVAGLDNTPYRASGFSPNSIGHVLALMQVVSALTGGQEEGVAFSERHDALGEGVPLVGEVVTENVIQSHFETMLSVVRSRLREEAKPGAEIPTGKVYTGFAELCQDALSSKTASELDTLLADKPSLWCATRVWLVGSGSRAMKRATVRRPDLVIARPHAKDGSAQSVAVEVELSCRYSPDELKNFMRAYSNSQKVYGRVVWVYKDERVRRKLAAAIEATDTGDLIHLVPLRNSDGALFTGNVLMEL